MSPHRPRPRRVTPAVMLGCAAAAPALAAPPPLFSQTPDRPLVVEVNLSPAFVAVAGGALADATVDELTVEQWRPGLTVGYRIAPRLSVAYGYHPGFDLVLREQWGFGEPRDLAIVLPHQTGDLHALDVRFHPRGGGLELTASLVRVGASSYGMTGTRTGATMTMGFNQYATDVMADWTIMADTRAAIGVGYSWTGASGLTLSAGLGVPIPFGDGHIERLTIEATQPGLTFGFTDQQVGRARLDAETFFAPVLLRMGVGWSFGLAG